MDAVRQIADAVLYEGYVLWPYRALGPQEHPALDLRRRLPARPQREASGRPADDAHRVPAGGPGEATVDVRVRFLHVVRRQVLSGREPVDELTVGGERYLTWEEATERELGAGARALADLAEPQRVAVDIPEGRQEESLPGGALVRTSCPLEGEIEIGARELAPGFIASPSRSPTPRRSRRGTARRRSSGRSAPPTPC